MARDVSKELWELLNPFIKQHPLKKDSVSKEAVELLIGDAVAFGVEEELLEAVKANPDGIFWDFLNLLPEGVPPGQEDILEDDDDE